MAGVRGYHTYRGRTPKSTVILAVVLVLIIIAAVAFIVFQQNVVYDESGRPHLELPWQETPAAAEDPTDVDITIQPPEQPAFLRAWQLPDTPLTDWTAAYQAGPGQSSAPCTAVALTMKDADSAVYFDSAVPAAAPFVRTDPATASALAAMTGSGTYTVARLACFLDPRAASANTETMGLKNTGGFIFYDGNNQQWLDPAKPAARQYLCGLAKELAALGFDEILLTDVGYPTVGKLDKIAYGETGKVQNLTDFLREMSDALAEEDVVLSLELSKDAVAQGGDSLAGISLADMAPLVDRIYAPAEEAETAALAQAVTAASADTVFVPQLSAPPADGQGSWMLLGT